MEKRRSTHGHYRTEARVVSVWLGRFPDWETYGKYFSMEQDDAGSEASSTCQFWRDVGIEWFDPDHEEGSGYIGEPVPVAELLKRGWSYVESFRAPLVEACREKGVSTANIVIFLFDFDYPTDAGYSSPYVTFIGAFPYVPDP